MSVVRRLVMFTALVLGLVVVWGSPARASNLCAVYVGNSQGDSVSVIDAVTNAVAASIGVGAGPIGVAIACEAEPPTSPHPTPVSAKFTG